MSSTLAATLAGPFIETCKAELPKVTLKFAVTDSQSIKARVEAHTLDMAVVFEDELVPIFSRKPLFRQRLYLVSREPLFERRRPYHSSSLQNSPSFCQVPGNVTRTVLDRAFAAIGASANVVAEADVWSGILAAVRTGMGSTVLPKGNLLDVAGSDLAGPLLIEPPLFLTASIIASGDFP